jgi:threonine synthase
MPFTDAGVYRRVSLGETESPLVEPEELRRAAGLPGLRLKLDSHLPTGSLKDRPVSAVMAGAVERKAPVVAISSSGNAAASLAAHAARAGVRAVVGVFAGIPAAKLDKIRVHAPVVLQVKGGMDEAEAAVRSLSRRSGWFNGEAFVNPYALEGEKTIAYEVCIQSGWRPPDFMVFPLGNAACLVASYKGFREMRELGLIDRLPRLAGVQFAACAPIATAFAQGATAVQRFHRTPSFSTTLMHEAPLAGALGLAVIRETGGCAVAVTDDEVRQAMRLLGQQGGIFAEPAGAIALAGALRLREAGVVGDTAEIVCLVSGSGMNHLEASQPGGRLGEPMSLEEIEVTSPERLLAAGPE